MGDDTIIGYEVFAGLLAACVKTALLAGVVSLALACVHRKKHGGWHRLVPPVLWLGGYIALLCYVRVACFDLFSQVSTASFEELAKIVRVGGCVLAIRPFVDVLFERLDSKFAPAGLAMRVLRDWFCLSAAVGVSALVLELPWNEAYDKLTQLSLDATTGICLLGIVTLYFMGLRTGVLPAAGVAVCCAVGIAQFLVIESKGVPFLPSDLTALSTAAAVSEGYVLAFDDRCVEAIGYAVSAVVVLSLVHPMPIKKWWHLGSLALNVIVVASLVPQLGAAVVERDYRSDFNLNSGWYWDELSAYEDNGLLPTFLAFWQDLSVEEPNGYDETSARAAEGELVSLYDRELGSSPERLAAVEHFAAEQPSYVFIMNESFADLSIMDGLGAGYEGPSFFNTGVQDVLMRGNVAVSVFGGGTEASEFELLTGVSMGYLGSGKTPYTTHDFTKTHSLVDQLELLGYQSCAIHPNIASNWNRDEAYEQMGFDEFLSIGDFENAEHYHSGVRDSATYEVVYDILENSDKPQLILDVTMANHGGYQQGESSISELDWQGVYPEGIDDDELNWQLNEYLACVNASDVDLSFFIERLRTLDKPVVLVFFGDHQPGFSDLYNNLLYPDEVQTSLAHRMRCYQTPYLIWANYDVTAAADDIATRSSSELATPPSQPLASTSDLGAQLDAPRQDTSVEALAALALHLSGASLTDFQKATLAAHLVIRQVNAHGYLGDDGVWYEAGEPCEYDGLYGQLEDINYLEFGSKY